MHPLICAGCGEWIDLPAGPAGPAGAPAPPDPGDAASLRCARCGHEQPFLRLPLFCVSGPSGTGKSTVGRLLVQRLAARFVVLEQDLLWVDGLRDPADEHHAFRSTWLRLAAAVQQNGRPVVLCGTVAPPEFQRLPERGLFAAIHYAALTCRPDVLAERLRRRPAWRGWDEPRIAEMLDYAAWIEDNAATLDPPMTLLDTTERSVEATADQVVAWIDAVAAAP